MGFRIRSERLINVPFEIPDDETEQFSCPRCSNTVNEHFYGSCESCRTQLREFFLREAVDVEAEKYEPKMNVTPNMWPQRNSHGALLSYRSRSNRNLYLVRSQASVG
jgi:predicted RNA-binding Zn-ribbon protein involved in translation (DUF1610 family)